MAASIEMLGNDDIRFGNEKYMAKLAKQGIIILTMIVMLTR
ncbi:hypothetical protein NRIC_23250 [Enterococcus florum]|uniref:Uncharacterized protein n=1 Tax=Enterococcus florum TaxID=2480627 RepID=A0A4P5PD05_9ENTE|nr:hypothetical protein [Enterococcus florum]GCF94434.1 hypothetical protein NRIC_23250 [Enterococcus florum]